MSRTTGRVRFLDLRRPCRSSPKRPQPQSRRSAGRAHVSRAPAVAAGRRRVTLRPGPATARPDGHQGLRPRSLAVQRQRRRPGAGVEPRLRAAVGQHVADAIRRPARGRRPFRAAALLDESGQARRPDRPLLRRRAASRERSATRCTIRRSTSSCGDAAQNTRIHPDAAARGRRSVRWDGSVVRAGHPATYTFQTFSNAGLKMWVEDRLGRRSLAPGLAAVERRRARRRWRRAAATSSKSSGRRTRATPARCAGRRPRRRGTRRSGRRSATASTTTSSTAPSSTRRRRLPPRDRRGADDAALGLRLLAIARALQDAAGKPRRARRLPVAAHPDRRHRAGLAVLEDRHVGIARSSTRSASPIQTGGSARSTTKHAKLMISVWGKFYPGTANFEAMHGAGVLYEGPLKDQLEGLARISRTRSTTPSIPAARKLFWEQMKPALFDKGVDAWWMDATEPDLMQPLETLEGQRNVRDTRRRWAPGARMLNAYSLVNSQGIYEGQRAAAPDQRVVHPDALGVRGPCSATRRRRGRATSRRRGRRCASRSPRASGFSLSGSAVLDVGHRRLRRRRRASRDTPHDARRGGRVEGAERALVPVQHVHAAPARARPDAEPRDVVPRRRVRSGLPDRAQVRSPALSPAAVCLFAGRRRDARRRHDAAAAGDGFPVDRGRARSATSTCSARRCW